MNFDVVADLNDLEQEMLIIFKYWYDCDFEADIMHPSYVAARDKINVVPLIRPLNSVL